MEKSCIQNNCIRLSFKSINLTYIDSIGPRHAKLVGGWLTCILLLFYQYLFSSQATLSHLNSLFSYSQWLDWSLPLHNHGRIMLMHGELFQSQVQWRRPTHHPMAEGRNRDSNLGGRSSLFKDFFKKRNGIPILEVDKVALLALIY